MAQFPSQTGQRLGREARKAFRCLSIEASFSGSYFRNTSTFSRIWAVYCIETQTEENRSSVQIACNSA